MEKGVIFIAGTYGVGKSTLCDKLCRKLNIPAFSEGDLISEINGETYGKNKVVRFNNSDYLQKARKYGHFTGYKN